MSKELKNGGAYRRWGRKGCSRPQDPNFKIKPLLLKQPKIKLGLLLKVIKELYGAKRFEREPLEHKLQQWRPNDFKVT